MCVGIVERFYFVLRLSESTVNESFRSFRKGQNFPRVLLGAVSDA
jgi:hypothetical protein